MNSIQAGNISISAGNIKANDQRKTIRIIGEISSSSELENFVVKSSYNNSVLLKDIAEIKFKEKEVTTYAREKGKPVVTSFSLNFISAISFSKTELLYEDLTTKFSRSEGELISPIIRIVFL